MNKIELRKELDLLDIKSRRYSLNGDLNLDTIILLHNKNNNKWEVFYFDERGQKNDVKILETESEACYYVLKLFKDAKDIEEKFGINT